MGKNVPDISHPRVVMMAMAVIMFMGMVMIVVMRMLVIMVVIVVVFVGMVMFMRVMMIVGMVMAFLLFPVDRHRHMGAGDTALYGRLGGKFHPGNVQVVHTLHKLLRMGMEFQQSRSEHVPSSAHIAFQIQCFHVGILLTRSIVTDG
jgi:hypothetical protein